MLRAYEIFEVLPIGSLHRVAVASGLELAKLKLRELADQTRHECFAADSTTHQIVAQLNVPLTKRQLIHRLFVISYDEQLGLRRAEILRSYGYDVISVVGNHAAKIVLTPAEPYDLFIVGHAAPEEIRQEMVAWLKAKYPKVKILALNPPGQQLPAADYNVPQNEPENWLPIVFQQCAA